LGLAGRVIVGGLLFGGLMTQACAQGIFTCVDAKGRRLTADRPIIECNDREQRELSPGGLLKRKIGPELTAQERAAEEEKARLALEERNRLAEEKKRDRALLARYPDRAAHDKERREALGLADDVIAAANKNVAELGVERKRLETELEFFNNDPAKVPGRLKRQIDENLRSIQAQKRFVQDKEAEKQRAIARYAQELARLQQLWALRASPVTAAGTTTTTPKP